MFKSNEHSIITPLAHQNGSETLDEFDKALLSAIEGILQYTVGDVGTQIIFNYLEKNCFPKSEIPNNLNKFSEELRRLLGSGRGQILGSAPILEEAIAENLCSKLGMKMNARFPIAFSSFIMKLKEDYCLKAKQTDVLNKGPYQVAVSATELTVKP